MRLQLASVLLLAASAAAGTEQRILVGSDPASGAPSVSLNPAHANLSVGDTLAFTFWRPGTNLSIVQSSRERACSPLAGGFDSGWIQSSEDNIIVYRMFLTNLEPLFYYALNGSATVAQPQKCAEEMFGSVNASPAQIEAYKTLAVGVTAFPLVQSSASGTGVTPSSTGSPATSPGPTSTNKPGAVKDDDGKGKNKDEDKDEDGKGGLSTGTISAIAICAVLGAGAVFWFVRRRKTRRRRPAERRPPRDPPPAYVAVQPASISAGSGLGSGMTEVWEEVGGRTIMRAPSLSHAGTHSQAGSSTQTAPSSTGSATLDTNPFASPEDDVDETATLRSSSRPTSPSASAEEEEDAPPEYMSSHSVPPPFSAVARR